MVDANEGISVRTVMIVEDNDETREFLAWTFAQDGFCVAESASMADALERLEKVRVDLLLSDYRLGDGDGLSLFEAAQRKHLLDGAPLILCTGDGSVTAPASVVVLHKPIEAVRVLAVARRLLSGQPAPIALAQEFAEYPRHPASLLSETCHHQKP